MKKLGILLICIFACALCVYAQEGIKQPDLQMADGYFFDPTRKVKERPVYAFGVEWRIETGYIQVNQRTKNKSYPDMFLHGGQVGLAIDFLLPYHFSIQTGLYYSLSAGRNVQHYLSIDEESQQVEYIEHSVMQHNLSLPIRAFYTQKLAKKWRMLFYAGPQFSVCVAQPDEVDLHLSEQTLAWVKERGIHTESYDRVGDGDLRRFNVQLGVGGGFEWDRLRLVAGYDFGLNNLVSKKVVSNQHIWEWSWFVRMGVRIGKDREYYNSKAKDL